VSDISPVTGSVNPLKPKRERIRKYSRGVEVKRKLLGEGNREALYICGGKKEHLVRRYPGNAR
jgi:hypothetical protein